MNKHLPLWYLVLYVSLLVVLNAVFESLHLYFFVWWLDIPMHLLSGFGVGLGALWAVSRENFRIRATSPSAVFFVAALSAFVVGVFWELFSERFGHVAPAHGGMVVDTIKDLVDDVLGGVLAAAFFTWRGYNKSI